MNQPVLSILVHSARIFFLFCILSAFPFLSVSQTLPDDSKTSFDPVRKAKFEMANSLFFRTEVPYKSAFLLYSIGYPAAAYGGRYLLLQSPMMALEMVQSNVFGLVSEFTYEGVLALVREMVKHPDQVCVSLARSMMNEGLNDYKTCFDIVRHYRETEMLGTADSKTFLVNRWGVFKLPVAKQLYQESREEYSIENDVAEKVVKEALAKFESVYKKKLSVDKNLPLLDAAFFIADIMEILRERKAGLAAYPPYLKFMKCVDEINIRQLKEMKELEQDLLTVHLVLNLKTHGNERLTTFLGDHRFDFWFTAEPRNDFFRTEMSLNFDFRPVDLYDAPHGPGLNQIAVWPEDHSTVFDEIIRHSLGYLPFHLTGNVTALGANEREIELTIRSTLDIDRSEVFEFSGTYEGMAAGDLIHVFFRDDKGQEYDFSYSTPECIYLLINKDRLKGKRLRITYVTGEEYNSIVNMTLGYRKILLVENEGETSQDWWNSLKGNPELKDRYSEIAENFLQFLYENYGNTY